MMPQWVIVAFTATLLAGCATGFQETHYFKAELATGGGIPNYYRLSVSGKTLLSSARYVSGYFDEDTLNSYFNEFAQPANGAFTPSVSKLPGGVGAGDTKTTGTGTDAQPLTSSLTGKKLIMILSTNSDEIATQIGTLASSKQFTASLAGLLAHEQYASADESQRRLALDQKRASTTADVVSKSVTAIPDAPSAEQVRTTLVAAINLLASDLGYDGAFSTLDDAAQWLQFNRGRLSRSVR